MIKPTQIPKPWEAATVDWFTAALSRDCPGTRVDNVEFLQQDDGTNRRARVALQYSSGEGPRQLFLKAHADAHRWVHLRNGNLFNEARFFSQPRDLPLDHPKVYKAIVDYWHLDFLLVMEDITLRGADPRDATRPMTVEQAASGLRGLARLHSQYWNQAKRDLRWVKTWKPAKGWQVGLRKRIPLGLERAEGLLPERVARMSGDEVVDSWVRYVGGLSQGARTLLHGDAHIGNTYVLPGNEVGFLDWQVLRWGGWSQDVGYFLVSALSEKDRRASERELLAIYRDALKLTSELKPSMDSLWLDYRRSMAYGLAVWLSTLGTDGWQSREISESLARRFAMAYDELDTSAALSQG